LIGEEPFTNVGALESITVDGGNENYRVTSGCLIDRRTGALLRGFGKSEIPADGTVLSIEAYAFSAQALEAVKIPSGVTSIGEGAFEKCKLLKHVKIPSTVTSIGDFAFCYCGEMTEIRIPESVRKIDSFTFLGCTQLKAIHLSYRCEIDENAIPKGCKIYRLETDFKTDNNGILTACSCKNEVIIIPNGIKGIGLFPFGSLEAKEIVIPESVTDIRSSSFSGIETLTSITADEGNPKYKSIDGVLYSKDGKELIRCPRGKAAERLILPEGLTKIGNNAFEYCSGLVSVHIPAGVTALNGYDDEAFKYCTSLTEITVAEENKKFHSADGNLYSKDGKTLIRYAPAKSAKSFTVPKDVTRIYKNAFEGCFKLEEIIIPQGVTSIEWGAFYDCSALTSVNIPSGVTEIDSYAFKGCSSLANVVIPDSVTKIGDKAFENCKKLSGIKVPGGVIVIGEEAFNECISLADLTVSEGVTEIRKRAFQNCKSLISVTLPDSVSTISDYAFFECDRLESLSVGKNCNVKTLVLPAGCKLKRRGLFDKIFKRKQS